MGQPGSVTEAEDETERQPWTVGRVAAITILVATFGFWVWAFSPWAPDDNPDRLEDRGFAEAAETRCRAALDEIDGIPSARAAETTQDRADQVEAGTRVIEVMLADLEELASGVGSAEESEILADWFEDWHQYVVDRWAHVDRLRSATDETSDRDLAFRVSATEGGGIYTERLDGFARVNDMDSCLVPGDV